MDDYDLEFARELLDCPEGVGRSAYLNEGRRYAKLGVDALRSRWAEALRRWLDHQSFERTVTLEYLTGELNARGLALPVDLAADEMKRMQAEVDRADLDGEAPNGWPIEAAGDR